MTSWIESAAGNVWMLWIGSAVAFSAPRTAVAQSLSSACAARVTLEGELDERWLLSVDRLCTALNELHDIDPSARLRITRAGNDVIVEVALGDGRVALRRVERPDDLLLTVKALTLLPPPPPPVEPTSAPAPRETAPVAPPPRRRAPIGFEIGAAWTVHIEATPIYLSTGLTSYAGLRLNASLLALTARWDVVEVMTKAAPPAFEMTNVGVGFMFARRIALAPEIHLDLGGSAVVLAQTQSAEIKSMPLNDTEADIRLGAIGRAVFGESEWRFTVGLDADFSPARVRQTTRVYAGFPTLPLWSVGVFVGALWGEQ